MKKLLIDHNHLPLAMVELLLHELSKMQNLDHCIYHKILLFDLELIELYNEIYALVLVFVARNLIIKYGINITRFIVTDICDVL